MKCTQAEFWFKRGGLAGRPNPTTTWTSAVYAGLGRVPKQRFRVKLSYGTTHLPKPRNDSALACFQSQCLRVCAAAFEVVARSEVVTHIKRLVRAACAPQPTRALLPPAPSGSPAPLVVWAL